MALSSPLLDTRTIDEIMGGLMKQAQIDLPNRDRAAAPEPGAAEEPAGISRRNVVSVRPPSTAKAPLTFSSCRMRCRHSWRARRAGRSTSSLPAQAPATTFETMRDFTVPGPGRAGFHHGPVWDRFSLIEPKRLPG